MRLFVAVELPDVVKKVLIDVQRSSVAGVRWLTEDQLHLTLQFLGEIGETELEGLRHALGAIRCESFELELTKIGSFPRPASPRVVWVGVTGHQRLAHLAEEVRRVTAMCGVVSEERRFVPHITLGRVKQHDPGDRHITELIGRPASSRVMRFRVDSFALFQSTLQRQGALHTVVTRYPLIP